MNQEITYTEKEIEIINTKQPMKITDEEFLILSKKAFELNDIMSIIHLNNLYSEITDKVCSSDFMEKHNDPADFEDEYRHPILCPTNQNRYTQGCIKDMVCYLIGTAGWTDLLFYQLQTTVPYKPVFNYLFDEYVHDYNVDILWHSFFLGQEELSCVIKKREITDMFMLVYRTMDYYERSEHQKHNNKTTEKQFNRLLLTHQLSRPYPILPHAIKKGEYVIKRKDLLNIKSWSHRT